jgi:hypothetical protein
MRRIQLFFLRFDLPFDTFTAIFKGGNLGLVNMDAFALFKAGQKVGLEPGRAGLLIGLAQLALRKAVVVSAVRLQAFGPSAVIGLPVGVNPVFQAGVIMGLEQGAGPSQAAVEFSDFIQSACRH